MPGKQVVLHIKTRLQFIRTHQYLYECEADNGTTTNVRTYCESTQLDEIIIYFYSDRPGEKYIKIFLKKCE